MLPVRQVVPAADRHRNERGRLVSDVAVAPFHMTGFSVKVQHREGQPLSQVRDVRLTASTVNVRGDLVQETLIGHFVLPLVPANTVCYFPVDVDVRGNLVTLECLTAHGDLDMCPVTNFQLCC